jgi:hypothetical protein
VVAQKLAGSVSFTDADGFVVGSVNGLHGVLASAGFVDLTSLAGDVEILSTPALYDLNVASRRLASSPRQRSMFKIAAGAAVKATGSGTFQANRMDRND